MNSRDSIADKSAEVATSNPHSKRHTNSISNFNVIAGVVIAVAFAIVFIFYI